jgi:hypothetical protein
MHKLKKAAYISFKNPKRLNAWIYFNDVMNKYDAVIPSDVICLEYKLSARWRTLQIDRIKGLIKVVVQHRYIHHSASIYRYCTVISVTPVCVPSKRAGCIDPCVTV